MPRDPWHSSADSPRVSALLAQAEARPLAARDVDLVVEGAPPSVAVGDARSLRDGRLSFGLDAATRVPLAMDVVLVHEERETLLLGIAVRPPQPRAAWRIPSPAPDARSFRIVLRPNPALAAAEELDEIWGREIDLGVVAFPLER